MHNPACESDSNRISKPINNSVDFSCQSTSASADGLETLTSYSPAPMLVKLDIGGIDHDGLIVCVLEKNRQTDCPKPITWSILKIVYKPSAM